MSSLTQLGRLLLSNLPRSGVKWACCYGSKVMESTISGSSQLDVLVAVEEKDLSKWHQQNLLKNPKHYSYLCRTLGNNFVMQLQHKPPGLFFHPFIKIPESTVEFKYGIMSVDCMVNDLKKWESFYIAGRLQKPVRTIFPLKENEFSPSYEHIKSSISTNHFSALATALLLLYKVHFTEYDLYLMITKISYMGDVRAGVGENLNKAENIVCGNVKAFRALYGPALNHLSKLGYIRYENTEECEHGRGTIKVLCSPRDLVVHLPETIVPKVADLAGIQQHINEKLTKLNHQASRAQSTKGLFTAGLGRSFTYVLQKIKKRITSTKVK